jgi:quinoprotein glucose dehydrogenase
MRVTPAHLIMLCVFIPLIACSQVIGNSPQGVEEVFRPEGDTVKVEVWVEDLQVPWSLIFLPDGRALVSERPGTVRLIEGGKVLERPYARLDVAHTGEGGLMGLAIHPDFPKEPYVYAMHTYRRGEGLYNRVVRLKHRGMEGEMDRVVLDNIPGARLHNGGRIAFGPDGNLYVATGENFESDLAQDLNSLGGKILRVTPDGKVPPDNPFKGSPVYSYGHRNPQGLAWQPSTGRLFASEHGPSGEFGRFGHDEINIIVKGGNYGWPKVIGAGGMKEYVDPIVVWKKATPPSGMTFYRGDLIGHLKGDLLVATLRSESLIRLKFAGTGERVFLIERWFTNPSGGGKYGRTRDVVEGPDGALYFLTNNTDGRGSPRNGDDRIYRIVPKE